MFGIPCNCCNAGVYNTCSFEPDGTLRWTTDWTAIKGSANGGMDVFDRNAGRGTHRISVHVVGTKLVAVGTKSGNIYVAALNISDGSEALALTDTGQSYNVLIKAASEQYTVVVGSSVVFGGIKGTSTSQQLERYAVTASGGITTTTGTNFPATALANAVGMSPLGEIAGYKINASGDIVTESVDGSGTSGTHTHPVDRRTAGGIVLGTEKALYEVADAGAGVGNRHQVKYSIPHGSAPTSINTPVATTMSAITESARIHHFNSSDQLYLIGIGANPNIVRLWDLPSDSQSWATTYASSNMTSVADSHIGQDGWIYLANGASTGNMSISAVDTSGSINNESATIANTIYQAGLSRVWSDASGYATASWWTSSVFANNVARFQRTGGALVLGWQWEGVPQLCPTVDGSGNLYLANVNIQQSLELSGMSQVV